MNAHPADDPTQPDAMDMSSLNRLMTAVTRPAGSALDAATALLALPRRVIGMITEAEQALAAVRAATARADALIDRVNGIVTQVEEAVQAAYETIEAAALAIEQASKMAATAAPLVASYSEPLRRLEPAVRRLAETTDSQEVDALVALIDRLPRLADAMNVGVIPLLDRLDKVGPDVNQLLDSVSDLNRMANRLPRVFRRRGEPTP
jgi:DNA repair ATPase RecN